MSLRRTSKTPTAVETSSEKQSSNQLFLSSFGMHSHTIVSLFGSTCTLCVLGGGDDHSNCRGDPFCLRDFGSRGIWDDSITDTLLGNNPSLLSRATTTGGNLKHCGLLNPHNRCYANVCLQMIHYNVVLRDSILNLIPPLPSDSMGYKCINAMQMALGSLALSQRSVYDTASMLELFDVPENVQNDAAELLRILIHTLEDINPQRTDASMPTILKRMEGKMQKTWTCCDCGCTSVQVDVFTQLFLDIKGKNNLNAAMDEHLKAERLSGDCQAYCEHCGKNRDKDVTITVKEAPDVLVISLHRAKLLDNDKGSFQIKDRRLMSFPPELNVGEMGYVLVEVKYHLGSGEDAGHYVNECMDLDKVDEVWNKCNDDKIEVTQNPTLSTVKPSKQKTATKKGNTRSSGRNGSNSSSSSSSTTMDPVNTTMDNAEDEKLDRLRDAYQLQYMRKDLVTTAREGRRVQVPEAIQIAVENDNKLFQAQIDTYDSQLRQLKLDIDQRKAAVKHCLELTQEPNADWENCHILSKVWWSQWATGTLLILLFIISINCFLFNLE